MIRRILFGCFVLWALSAVGASALVVSDPLTHPDALLVLAGGEVYGERLRHAVDIFHEGENPLVLLTNDGQQRRWSRQLQRNLTSVERAVQILEDGGVPPERIQVLPGTVHGTSDEAQALKRYVETHRLRSIVAVTSPYHTRRTLWTLRRFLGDEGVIVGIEPVPTSPATPTPRTWWSGRQGWRAVGLEFVKLPYYWVRFSLPNTRGD
jgi:uncharacterized SAM-binding protein YcdF (DUF218 family)